MKKKLLMLTLLSIGISTYGKQVLASSIETKGNAEINPSTFQVDKNVDTNYQVKAMAPARIWKTETRIYRNPPSTIYISNYRHSPSGVGYKGYLTLKGGTGYHNAYTYQGWLYPINGPIPIPHNQPADNLLGTLEEQNNE